MKRLVGGYVLLSILILVLELLWCQGSAADTCSVTGSDPSRATVTAGTPPADFSCQYIVQLVPGYELQPLTAPTHRQEITDSSSGKIIINYQPDCPLFRCAPLKLTLLPKPYSVTTNVTGSGTVEPIAVNEGSGNVSLAGTFLNGTKITFAITPSAGWGISSVNGTRPGQIGSSCNSGYCSYDFTVGPATTVVEVVCQELHEFVVTKNVTCPSAANCGTLTGPGTISPDSPRTYTFTPQPRYGVRQVQVNGQPLKDTEWQQAGSSGSYTFPAVVTRDQTITVTFDDAYVIKASAAAHGTITPSGSVSVVKGGSKTFVVTPAAGYSIDYVNVDGSYKGPISAFTFSNVTKDSTISAYFKNSGPRMTNYCSAPTTVPVVKPNLLFMLDNSASMLDLAYTGTDHDTYCLDDSYDNDKGSYVGFFDPGTAYSYDSASSRFIATTGIPATCNTVSSSYLCLDMDAPVSPAVIKAVSRFVASGKFLNWLTMSKLDLAKWVLTGGKFDTANAVLIGESRGCEGNRLVKLDKKNLQVTFAVRGPNKTDRDFHATSAAGGMTRIEIYDGKYNSEDCVKAVKDWQRNDLDQLQKDSKKCLNRERDFTTVNGVKQEVISKSQIFNTVLNDCAVSNATGTSVSCAETNRLKDDCEKRLDLFGGGSNIAETRVGDAVCGSNASHAAYNGNTIGFLGGLYASGVWNDLKDDRNKKDLCDKTGPELMDYCHELLYEQIIDPSESALMAGTNANVPRHILDAGVSDLGEPSGILLNRLAPISEPVGLVQEFGSDLNLGAMVFNDNGAASECSSMSPTPCPKSCSQNSELICVTYKDCGKKPGATGNSEADYYSCDVHPYGDGGKIISYINYDPVGDHSAGLVKGIDDIRAATWTPFGEAFYNAIGYFANRTDLRLDNQAKMDPSWDELKPPNQFSCQKNHIMIMSDGMSTADSAASMESLANLYKGSVTPGETGNSGSCPPLAGSRSLDDLAWIARHRNITTMNISGTASTDTPSKNKEYITTHVIFNGKSDGSPGECDPHTLMKDTALNGGGQYNEVSDPSQLYTALRKQLQEIVSSSNTGTDATILATGQGSGAIFLQEYYYPQKTFDGGETVASWLGEMQGLWYYIDPFLGGSTGQAATIRDDAGYESGIDHYLNLTKDNVVQFGAGSGGSAKAMVYKDGDGDGVIDATQPSGFPQQLDPDAVAALWRAGRQLWQRDPATRIIYTQTDDRTLTRLSLLDPTQSSVQKLLQAANSSDAARTISYIKGEDNVGQRPRKLTIPLVGTGYWKLGDIISSTPRIQSYSPLNSYHLDRPKGYVDLSYGSYVRPPLSQTGGYQNRGMVYVGANDGMLHAFKLGLLNATRGDDYTAKLSGSDLGKEEWAFIPKNVLPYLKYLSYPNYKHMNYVDGSLTLVDAAIGGVNCDRSRRYWDCQKAWDANSGAGSWRTVLIGGMGLAGASKPFDDSCSDLADSTGTCVRAPVSGAGLSSYFALDVTNQTFDPRSKERDPNREPSLLWEFTHPDLGFATSGASVLRIKARTTLGGSESTPDETKNGRWFAVFASGPTGPIDANLCQFKGTSNQNLKIFVVDLNAVPPLAEDSNYWVIDTKIENAFAGSLGDAGIDTDKSRYGGGSYQDDALYFGYTSKADDGTWTDGGVVRVLTKENPDPSTWKASVVIKGVGAVTTPVVKLQDRQSHKLWLYFGTGRYFYSQDDMGSPRALYGVQEPCYRGNALLSNVDTLDPSCKDLLVEKGNLKNKTDDASSDRIMNDTSQGWYINLDGQDIPKVGSERVVARPTTSTSGVVYFLTLKPSADLCAPDGKSYLWAVDYTTGGAPKYPPTGKMLVPLSTGELKELDRSYYNSKESKGGRRSDEMTGRAGGIAKVSNSSLRPLKKIIHIQER